MQRLVVFICISFSCLFSHGQAETKLTIAKTVVRIKSGGRSSTGFFWKNGSDIVATLHSIGNKNSIRIYIPAKNNWYDATIKRIHKSSDLVLLRVQGVTSSHYISTKYQNQPPIDRGAFSIGYISGNGSYQDRDFKVGLLQGNKLRNLLPASAENEIAKLSFPSLETEITYLKGHLLKGFSGSPVVDHSGRLIGVADGGLNNGAASISWCIAAKSLDKLESSTDAFPTNSIPRARTLFAGDDYIDNEVISNGTHSFRKTATKTFAELDRNGTYSNFAEMGLFQLLAKFRQSNINYEDFRYNIYTEMSTGATIAIPDDMNLTVNDDFFYAENASNDIRVIVRMDKSLNPQLVSLNFEEFLMQETNIRTWIIDQRLSFMIPLQRPDNVIINRKAWFNQTPNRYMFEVLAFRYDTFMGMSIIIDDAVDGRTGEFLEKKTLAKLNLGSQLSTFAY